MSIDTKSQESIKEKTYSREELISICEAAVVHCTDWCNRDSFGAQNQLNDIYEGLTAGFEYEITEVDKINGTIWINFISLPGVYPRNCQYLDTCSLEDYFETCDPERETEMFNNSGIDWGSTGWKGGYLPTREKLIIFEGDDWY